jgi:hypothetical protein
MSEPRWAAINRDEPRPGDTRSYTTYRGRGCQVKGGVGKNKWVDAVEIFPLGLNDWDVSYLNGVKRSEKI